MEAELIGRDEELLRVQQFLERAGARALLIAGEAGVGKTSLWQAAVGRAEAKVRALQEAAPTRRSATCSAPTPRCWRTSPPRSNVRSRRRC